MRDSDLAICKRYILTYVIAVLVNEFDNGFHQVILNGVKNLMQRGSMRSFDFTYASLKMTDRALTCSISVADMIDYYSNDMHNSLYT